MSHLIFTKDFHELIRGKLQPGANCIITYDPLRIFSYGPDYIHGDERTPVTAHLVFDTGETFDLTLISDVGQSSHPVIRNDGLGSMLTSSFTIPENVKEITIWFSGITLTGDTRYDSDYGKNFHFRFSMLDLKITKSAVKTLKKNNGAEFQLELTADTDINAISVYFRQTNGAKVEGHLDLVLKAGKPKNTWQGAAAVPPDAIIAYEISYFVGPKWYFDNNNGKYYVVTPVGAGK